MMKKKAQFIAGDLFWNMLLAYRVIWIMGRYGAGKTSLAALCAARLLVEGRVERVVSNIPLSYSVPIAANEALEKAAILIDEAWIYLENRQSVMDYAGFVRKFDHILLLPSVFPIHPRLSYFYVQRVFNAYGFGLPLWVYKWNIANRGIKEHGYFAILHPTAIFNHYPTDFVPGDDGNISDALVYTAKLAGFKGTRTAQQKNKKGTNDDEYSNDDDKQYAEVMEEVSHEIGQHVEDFQKIANVIRRSRR